MRLAGSLWISTAATVLAACPAQAKEPFIFAWHVSDIKEADPIKLVGPYSEIAAAKLVPRSILENRLDVVEVSGKPVVPSGTQFAKLLSNRDIVCSLDAPKSSALKQKYVFGDERHICLTDDNKDGRYETYFKKLLPSDYLTAEGSISGKLTPIQATSLTRSDGNPSTRSMNVYLQYSYFAGVAGRLIFQTCLHKISTSGKDCFGDYISVDVKSLPSVFEALGGSFRVLEVVDSKVRIETIRPFQHVPVILRSSW